MPMKTIPSNTMIAGAIITIAALTTLPSIANDGTAELATGGLVFTKNSSIMMRSEHLFISMDEIRVRYVFFNKSSRDIANIVAFPMPNITFYDPYSAIANADPQNILGFTTVVAGRSVNAQVEQKAYANDIDQTALLRRLGITLAPNIEATRIALDSVPREEWAQLVKLGLVEKYSVVIPSNKNIAKLPPTVGGGQIRWPKGGNIFPGMSIPNSQLEPEPEPMVEEHLLPRWRLRTKYFWEQTFPARRELVIEHRYKPSLGSSVMMFGNSNSTVEDDYRKRYCIDDDFIGTVARHVAAHNLDAPFQEKHIEYILTTGANWAEPIGDFTLVVDKGKPTNLVSFCADGVRKISPTRFQVHRTNFIPKLDLSILILESEQSQKEHWQTIGPVQAKVSNRTYSVASLRPETLALINKLRTTLPVSFSQRRLVDADLPAVGCPKDGMAGPEDAPNLPESMRVVVPEGMASGLAYYSADEGAGTGVLAPKGWGCFGTYGSSGWSLYVTPRSLSDPILNRPEKLKDAPVVIKDVFGSDTSGRFPVAKISARIFPLARALAERVRDEGITTRSDFIFSPWASDRLTYLSDFAVSYVTPPGADGLGTSFGPDAQGQEPISGLVFLKGIGNTPVLERFAVRLEKGEQHLYAAIAVSSIALLDVPHRSQALFPVDRLNATEVTDKIYDWCQGQWRIPETVALCLLENEYDSGTELSYIYHRALNLPARNSEELRRSQRSWLNYQEANCKFHGGTAHNASGLPRVASARCLLLTTLQRLEELKKVVDQR
jgi:uncharacterized protein YecT (DUF1311 family)